MGGESRAEGAVMVSDTDLLLVGWVVDGQDRN